MAKKIFWLGMLAMVLAFGMTVFGCDNDPNDNGNTQTGGVFILTGIPEKYNGKYAFIEDASDEDESVFLAGCQNIDMATETFKFSRISNGRVSIPMWIWDEDNFKRYTGNDTVFVEFGIYESEMYHGNQFSQESNTGINFRQSRRQPSIILDKGNLELVFCL